MGSRRLRHFHRWPTLLVAALTVAAVVTVDGASAPTSARLGSGVLSGVLSRLGAPPAPSSSVSPPPVTVVSGGAALPVTVSGSQLVQNGQPFVMRGVDVGAFGADDYPDGLLTSDMLNTIEAWGANMVRLELSSDQYLQQCAESYDTNYRSQLTQAVSDLTTAGIYVILDIHASNPDCIWKSGQTSQVVALPGDDAQSALASLAATYGSNPLVGFEPFNEPEGCAEATTGPGASHFIPSSTGLRSVCTTEDAAALAWNDPGTATVQGVETMGLYVGGKSYAAPGMDALYGTVMANVPAGSPPPLVFLDANYFASDPATFDTLGGPLATATNAVEVFHPYDCQAGGQAKADCLDTTPEKCDTIAATLGRDMTDPATGGVSRRPVVFDEFNFPAGVASYDGELAGGTATIPIRVYQHGYWVNNEIATMQRLGADGWGVFYLANPDVDAVNGPYSIAPGITRTTPGPWPVSANDAPAVAAMQGQALTCTDPPFGYG